ncbi:stage II sporulation protein M [Bacillus sp. BRMEA1]|uniref:stage II sporulation protein M n=1 Tax=Neobacillus endophyticus TaxID=2738405 RepID=UPI0015642571|nr:stage II sporulation protein M [Neobacillus endophyticus]NRD81114.1 stage II sporulation protein M [Neobacillus endophyticus]
MNLLKNEWSKFTSYYKKHFRLMLTVYILTVIVSFFIIRYGLDESITKKWLKSLMKGLSEQGLLKDNNDFHTMLSLFLHNTLVSVFAFIGGFIPLLIFPYFSVMYNGTTMGLILAVSSLFFGSGSVWKMATLGVLPHGITEITASILSTSLGSFLSLNTTRKLFKKENKQSLKETLKMTSTTFVLVVIPLLLISAFLEAYATPLLLKWGMK